LEKLFLIILGIEVYKELILLSYHKSLIYERKVLNKFWKYFYLLTMQNISKNFTLFSIVLNSILKIYKLFYLFIYLSIYLFIYLLFSFLFVLLVW